MSGCVTLKSRERLGYIMVMGGRSINAKKHETCTIELKTVKYGKYNV